MSLPILTSGAITKKLAASYMGAELDPNAKFALTRSMFNGVRANFNPAFKKYFEMGERQGIFDVELRKVTELQQQARSLDVGVTSLLEDAMQSTFVRLASKGADLSEEAVRRAAFGTGVTIAKEAYPDLPDAGIMAFARNFVDESIGNYTASQRPAMMQGTFGVAMGLFQTYMLTMAQHIYNKVEAREWAGLGRMMFAQAGIFGAAGLPGFHQVSEAIGTHFSDRHVDLETGTFRAIPDPAANMILYGLPSSLGPGINTRGDIQPRVPNPFQGISSIPTVNILGQSYTALENVVKAAWSMDENSGRAMLEALSLQSVSRPIARISELVTGNALTGKGNVVFSGNELYTVQSVLSRVMGTRPLAEIKVREAQHLNRLYGAADSDNRKAVSMRLKEHIRTGELDGDILAKLSDEYLRKGGTSTGWQGAVQDALVQSGSTGSAYVKNQLKPDSPLQTMISDSF